MSEWVQNNLPCPKCSSSDAYSINDRGWGKCFSCGVNVNEEGNDSPQPTRTTKVPKDLIPFGEFVALRKRGLSEETCKKFGYFVNSTNSTMVQVAPYRNQEGEVAAQKVRGADKAFSTTGDFKNLQLFGQHLWSKASSKKLVITEGEIDCMSVSQMQSHKWPVVSIPNGAQGAVKSIKDNLEFVLAFSEVILMFDMDDAGREAAIKVSELLPIGKAKIAKLPLKDPNEVLVNGDPKDIINAIWNAEEYRPDGIVEIDDILAEIEKSIEMGLPWFLPTLTKHTFGRRYGEIYGFGAGTGIGKSDLFTQQMAFDVEDLALKVGAIFLESKPVEVGRRLAGKIDGEKYHIPNGDWDKDKLRATVQSLRGKVTFYDSWGETEWDIVKGKIRYMAVAKDIKIIYLDHLTAMADTANEKGSIEQIMKEMAGLAQELNIIIHFISHLSTPEGKSHEEGGRVMIKHFKGSRAIGFWSHYMFGMERNTQAEEEEEQQTTIFRVLKDRYTGQATGKTIRLGYEDKTGRLFEALTEDAFASEFPTTETKDF